MWTKFGPNFGQNSSNKFKQNPSQNHPGRPPGHPKSIPGPFPSTLVQRKATCQPPVAQKAAKVGRKSAQRRPFWEPSAPQKCSKMCPGTKKCFQRPHQRYFLSCSLAVVVRTRSLDRFLKGPTLQNRVPTTSRSTILTKSPFSKKHRKSSLRAPVLDPKMAKNRRRGYPKSQKMQKDVFFGRPKVTSNFGRKKTQKTGKMLTKLDASGLQVVTGLALPR